MPSIDKNRIRKRFARSASSYHQAAEVQRDMAETLLDQLFMADGRSEFQRILEAGCGSGLLTDRLEERLLFERLYLLDLVDEWSDFHQKRPGTEFITGDIEQVELPHDLDLVISNALFQWIGDLPRLLGRFADALCPGGILAFTTFGPENLREVAALTDRGLAYPGREELLAMLEKHFEPLACREETVTCFFERAVDILRHFKATGVTATGGTAWSRARQAAFETGYREHFMAEDGRLPLTYHPITLIARKRSLS